LARTARSFYQDVELIIRVWGVAKYSVKEVKYVETATNETKIMY
jgi:hypothetical protein